MTAAEKDPTPVIHHEHLTVHPHVLDMYERMIGDVHIENVLRHSAEVVGEALNAERATIYLVREDTQELESAAVIGNVAQMIRVPIRETSLAGYCALSGELFAIEDAYGDLSSVGPRLAFDSSWDQANSFRTRDVMCAPAIFEGKVLGVVQVLNRREGAFSAADMPPLRTMARFVAYSLHHARLYEELETMKCLKKEKAKFMRVLVHELKAPAAGARMLVTSLQHVMRDNEQVGGMLNKVVARMDKLLNMIGDVLHHSRINEGGPLGEVMELDLVAEAGKAFEAYRPEGEQKGLEMVFEDPGESVSVRFDQTGCELALSNLISNGVKYTQQGSVTVSIQRQDGEALLTVTDTGMGIPEKDLPKMFKEFFRASNARKSEVGGTGVGLAGVKELVERFGGKMSFSSKENQGSSFVVALPLMSNE